MSTKIYVVKYIKDPRRWEPRNVGVIATSDDSYASKFLGEQPDGKIYLTSVRYVVNDRDIYRDWIEYFRRTLTPGDEGISSIMEASDSNYWVVEAADVWQGEADPDAVVAEYFPKLVGAISEAREDEISDVEVVEQLLERAGVSHSEHLKREYIVDSAVEMRDGKPVPYKFHYFWENGHKIVGERLSVKNPDWTRGQLWKFGHIDPDITKVAFLTSPTRPELEAELAVVPASESIMVEDKDALDKVLRIFNE